jgi:hypothetical protein
MRKTKSIFVGLTSIFYFNYIIHFCKKREAILSAAGFTALAA